MPAIKPQLTPVERHQVRSLIFRDSVALVSIFLITVCLAVATYFLFNSYSDHRKELANRWFGRGQAAARARQPDIAIEDFRSALLYAPGQRQIEIALASALGSAGKLQEAIAYFNTLREAEPGNGEINLQLARLTARSGNQEQTKFYFHAAIYGNWEGDGYLQRRSARLELVRYLISQSNFEQARSELLVASGNAPSSDLEMQSKIAGLLIDAHYPADALNLYRQILTQHPAYLDALEGAAATAYTVGDYASAYRYLSRAIASPENGRNSAQLQAEQEQLRRLSRIIILDPSADLPPAMLAARLLEDRETALARLRSCTASRAGSSAGQLSSLSGGQNYGTPAAGTTTTSMPPGLISLSANWDAEPRRLTARDLLSDPAAQERERKLINETERVTAQVCGPPQGDDAILLRLAEVPSRADANSMQAQSGGQPHE
jgi:tetratricopeptide (TPR) repeat protein